LIVSESERESLIAAEAYFRAERRNFAAGHELEDWLAAEADVNARLSHVRKLVGFA
jgi:IS5 family transposase